MFCAISPSSSEEQWLDIVQGPDSDLHHCIWSMALTGYQPKIHVFDCVGQLEHPQESHPEEENVQTPHKKATSELNPWFLCCECTLLTTTPWHTHTYHFNAIISCFLRDLNVSLLHFFHFKKQQKIEDVWYEKKIFLKHKMLGRIFIEYK